MALPTISRWEGRLALVTGAGSGIGAEISRALVQYNINVVGCGRNKAKIEELAREFTKAGHKGVLHPFQCDLTKESDIEAMFTWIASKFGGIDICINNAGFSSGHGIIGCPVENMKEMLDTNVVSLMSCDNRALKSMMERGIDDGHIFHINSILGHVVKPIDTVHAYAATKFAVTAITEALRQELSQRKSNIRVTAISPGLVDTPFQVRALGKEGAEQFIQKLPHLVAKDVADALIYALSAPANVLIQDIKLQSVGAA